MSYYKPHQWESALSDNELFKRMLRFTYDTKALKAVS